MTATTEFFEDLDRSWTGEGPPERIPLRLIGSTALFVQTDYDRATKDSDIIEARELPVSIRQRLLDLAGKGTAFHRRHNMYLDIVPAALPFLPINPLWHPFEELRHSLVHFDIVVLDVVDVVVSKLTRYSPSDRGDIQAMVERDHIDPGRLVERFGAAIDAFAMDARIDDVPRYIRNLNEVQRDFLQVPETVFELP